MKEEPSPPVQIQRYNGPKKPNMPEGLKHAVLPLKVIVAQLVSVNRAQILDYHFLQAVVSDESIPEYNGYNTHISRSDGHSVKPAAKAIYTPLINMTLSDPDIMLTAMVESQRLTEGCGQAVTLFTNDQQLYTAAVNIKWVYPELFRNFIPRLGGMHMIMSFAGAIGTLMSKSYAFYIWRSS